MAKFPVAGAGATDEADDCPDSWIVDISPLLLATWDCLNWTDIDDADAMFMLPLVVGLVNDKT